MAVAVFSLIGLSYTNFVYIYRVVPLSKEIGITELLQVLEVVVAIVSICLLSRGNVNTALFALGLIPVIVVLDIALLWLWIEPLFKWGEPVHNASSRLGTITIRLPNRYWSTPLLVSGAILGSVVVLAAKSLFQRRIDAQ